MKITIEDNLKNKSIKNLRDYLNQLHEWFDSKRNIVYRGQSDSKWRLLPSLNRKEYVGDEVENIRDRLLYIEKYFKDEFLLRLPRFNFEYYQNIPLSSNLSNCGQTPSMNFKDWYTIIIGQHHRLPTRLLDFTKNPLVALYFALKEASNVKSESLAIWCIQYNTNKLIEFDTILRRNFKKCQTSIFFPPHLDQRISVQQALFVYFKEPDLPLEKECPFLENSKMHKIIIKNSDNIISQLLSDLDQVGINNETLFPDIDGLTEYLKIKLKYDSKN